MKKTMLNIVKSLMLPIIVYVFFLILNFDRFGNIKCLYTIFLQSIIPAIMGYAIYFGYISGIFDFTIGSRMIIAGLVGGILSTQYGITGLIVGCTVSSIIIGALTGILNWLIKIPSLVLTMGLTMVFEVIGQKMSGQFSFVMISPENSFLGSEPYNIIILFVIAIIFYFILNRTRFSYHTRAVGSNEIVAKNTGIKVQAVKLLTFVIGAVFLGIAALLQISSSGSMGSQVNLASAMILFKPLMGVLVALALQSFCNLTAGIFIGQFSINIIFIGLIASGLPYAFQDVMLGIFLILVMLFSENKNEIKMYFTHKKKDIPIKSV